jgi:hypothetical protein
MRRSRPRHRHGTGYAVVFEAESPVPCEVLVDRVADDLLEVVQAASSRCSSSIRLAAEPLHVSSTISLVWTPWHRQVLDPATTPTCSPPCSTSNDSIHREYAYQQGITSNRLDATPTSGTIFVGGACETHTIEVSVEPHG